MPSSNPNLRSTRVARPIDRAKFDDLSLGRGLQSAFERHAIYPRHNLAITLVGRTQTYGAHNLKRLQDIVYPLPDTGAQSLELPVRDIAYLGHSLGHRSLTFVLDDPDGILSHERRLYADRIGQRLPAELTNHISIVDVDTNYATQDKIDWLRERAPATVALRAIQTFPHVAPPTESINSNASATRRA